MKNSKLISIVLVVLLLLGWYSALSNNISESNDYGKFMSQGDEQFEKELYEKSYNSYVAASKVKMTKQIQEKIVLAYENYYQEFESYNTYRQLANVYASASENYPSNLDYWKKAIQLEVDYEAFDKAMKVYNNALSAGANKKNFKDLYKKILYSYSENGALYNDFINESDGYFLLKKGLKWQFLSSDMNNESDGYSLMSGVSVSDNRILYLVKDFEGKTYFLDGDNVINGKIKNLDIMDAKLFSEDKLAVHIAKSKWAYIDIDGNIISQGYDAASNYSDGFAVILKDGKWKMLDNDSKLFDLSFEDIKLQPSGNYAFEDIALAKENGKYGFYNKSFSKKLNDFACDDIDIVTGDNLVAFKSDDKWGFVNTSGKVIIKPMYENARSFSNGLAAVSIDDKWGFINKSNELVVPCKFLDAQYVSSKGTALVSVNEGLYNFIIFNFPGQIVMD